VAQAILMLAMLLVILSMMQPGLATSILGM